MVLRRLVEDDKGTNESGTLGKRHQGHLQPSIALNASGKLSNLSSPGKQSPISLNTSGKLSSLHSSWKQETTSPIQLYGTGERGKLVRPASLPIPSPSSSKTKTAGFGNLGPEITRLPDDWGHNPGKRWTLDEKNEIERLLKEFRENHIAFRKRPGDRESRELQFKLLGTKEVHIRDVAAGGEAGEKAVVLAELMRPVAQTYLKVAEVEHDQLNALRMSPGKDEQALHRKRCVVWETFQDAKVKIEQLETSIATATGLPGGYTAVPIDASCTVCGFVFRDAATVCKRCKAKRVVQTREDPELYDLWQRFEAGVKKALAGAQADLQEGESIIRDLHKTVQGFSGAHIMVMEMFSEGQEALLQCKHEIIADSNKAAWKPSLHTKTSWFEFTFDRRKDKRNRPFGLEMQPKGSGLCIKSIMSGSLAEAWNERDGEKICVDDLIVEINSACGDTDSMLNEYKRSTQIHLKAKRVTRTPNWQPPKSDFYFGKKWSEVDTNPLVVAVKQIETLEEELRRQAGIAEHSIKTREAAMASETAMLARTGDGIVLEAVAVYKKAEQLSAACRNDVRALNDCKMFLDQERLRMAFEERVLLPVIEEMLTRVEKERDAVLSRVTKKESLLADIWEKDEDMLDNAMKTRTGETIHTVLRLDLDGTPAIASLVQLKDDEEVYDKDRVRMTHRVVYLDDTAGMESRLSRPRFVCYDPGRGQVSDTETALHSYSNLPLIQFSLDRKFFVAAIVGQRSADEDLRHGMTHQLLYLSRKSADEWVRLDHEDRTLRMESGKRVPFKIKEPLLQWSFQDGIPKAPEIVLGPDFDGKKSSGEMVQAAAELVELQEQLQELDAAFLKATLQKRRAETRVREVKRDALDRYADHISSQSEQRREALSIEVDRMNQELFKFEEQLQSEGVVAESSVFACMMNELTQTKQTLEGEIKQTEAQVEVTFGKILQSMQNAGLSDDDWSVSGEGDRSDYIEDMVHRQLRLHPTNEDLLAIDEHFKAFRQLQQDVDAITKALEINRIRLALSNMVLHCDRAGKSLNTIKEAGIITKAVDGVTKTVQVQMREGFSKGQLVTIAYNTDDQDFKFVEDVGHNYVVFKAPLKGKHPRGTPIVFRSKVLEKQSQLANIQHQISDVAISIAGDTTVGLTRMDRDLAQLRCLRDDARVMLVEAERPHHDMRIVEQNFYKSRLAAFVSDTDEGKMSPRKTAPDLKFSQQTLDLHCRLAAEADAKEQVVDPWQEGGTGKRSLPKLNRNCALHFDMHLKASNIRISPDHTSASWLRGGYGGFVFSVEPLKRKGLGRYFEVMIEEVDTKYGSDGIGVGLAARPNREDLRNRPPDQQSVYEGFASENLSEAWLVGYDGRANILGQSRYLLGQEIPKTRAGQRFQNGMFPPRRGRFADAIGQYEKDDNVECLRPNSEEWIPATVVDVDKKDNICLDVNGRTVWMSIEQQTRMVRPPRGIYQHRAGTYRQDDWVEVYVSLKEDWAAAQVLNVDDGSILVDSAPDIWIPVEEQAHNVRPCRGFRKGGRIGLLNTPEGHLYYFWNDEVKYAVMNANIPWNRELNAVIDLDGCIQSIHLMDRNSLPAKVVSSFLALPKPGKQVQMDNFKTTMRDENALLRADTRTLESELGKDVSMLDSLDLQAALKRDSASPWMCNICSFLNLGLGRFCERCQARNPTPPMNPESSPKKARMSRSSSQASLSKSGTLSRLKADLPTFSQEAQMSGKVVEVHDFLIPQECQHLTELLSTKHPKKIAHRIGGPADTTGVPNRLSPSIVRNESGSRLQAIGNRLITGTSSESSLLQSTINLSPSEVTPLQPSIGEEISVLHGYDAQVTQIEAALHTVAEDKARFQVESPPPPPPSQHSQREHSGKIQLQIEPTVAPEQNDKDDVEVGDYVEIFSNSLNKWCDGEIIGITMDNGVKMVKVRYGSNGASLKQIQWGHDHIRRARKDNTGEVDAITAFMDARTTSSKDPSERQPEPDPFVPNSEARSHTPDQVKARPTDDQVKARAADDQVKVGDKVEIYSNTVKHWCNGVVSEVNPSNDGKTTMVKINYTTETGVSSKVIAWGHENVRPAKTASLAANSEHSALQPVLTSGVSGPSPRQLAQVKLGEKVEVYSQTHQQWYPGEIVELSVNNEPMMVRANYHIGNTISSKVISYNHPNLRRGEHHSPDHGDS